MKNCRFKSAGEFRDFCETHPLHRVQSALYGRKGNALGFFYRDHHVEVSPSCVASAYLTAQGGFVRALLLDTEDYAFLFDAIDADIVKSAGV